MREALKLLPSDARILDLGCASGSFPARLTKALTIRVDKWHARPEEDALAVLGDAGLLPFRSSMFDAIICSHSLEHFEQLQDALKEIGRVLRPEGFLFISVPDGTTLCDRVYCWLADGGGHVNRFESAERLAALVTAITSAPHRGTRTLCTSFSFMNRKNSHPPQPRRMVLFLWGSERFLTVLNALLRLWDRCFHGRASVYGWALYFGKVGGSVLTNPCLNVCVRCGQGHPSNWLRSIGAVRGRLLPTYRCPNCRTFNFFVRDEYYRHFWPRHSAG